MLQEITRPFSDAERRLLRRRSSAPKPGSTYWMRDERRAALVTISIGAAVFLIGVLAHYPVVGAIIAGAFALIRFIAYLKRRLMRQYALAHRQRLAEELNAGEAHAIICQPHRIIEREEFEDEGVLWFFDGGDGRYLAICGQEYCETPRFPSSHFEVVLGARHRIVLGIRSRGVRVPSTLVVTADDIAWDHFPEAEITVFSAPTNADLPIILRSLRTTTTA